MLIFWETAVIITAASSRGKTCSGWGEKHNTILVESFVRRPSIMARTGVARRTVLVVEDDPALRELYGFALRAAGFACVAVEDGLAALQQLELQIPHIVVLDLDLPRMPGRDVHQELKATPETQHVPVVIVTASDTQALDPDDFACILRKPISTDDLVAAVQRCLETNR